MNIYDLKKHLKTDCKKNRSCQTCKLEFETMHEFHEHIRYFCQGVEITCNECDEVFTRREFRKSAHTCYKKVRQKMDQVQYQMKSAGPKDHPEIILMQLRLEN